MESWPGFQFSAQLMKELVAVGLDLLQRHGVTDLRQYRRVCLRHCRRQLYGYVEMGEWGVPQADLRCGMFFWGTYRPAKPWRRFNCWSWQTPRRVAAVTATNCTLAMRHITNREISLVLYFLKTGTVISREEFACATLLAG